MEDIMRSLGTFLVLAGLFSIVLRVFDTGLEVRVLMWIDNWGTAFGWGIRIGFVAAGAILFLIGSRRR
jgi:hypothetical protein